MESDILLERKHAEEKENEKRIRISGTLLEDALYKRNPDWIKDRVDIYRLTDDIRIHRFRHGTIWRTVIWFAFSLWIIPTIFQRPYAFSSSTKSQFGYVTLEIIGMTLLLTDMAMKVVYRGFLKTIQKWWEIVFLISVFLMLVDILFIRHVVGFPWSRMFQPFVLFCVLPSIRNSTVSTLTLLPEVFPVFVLEWISILIFSCLAVVLFRTNDSEEAFFTLNVSLLAMFELSTTVVNPDVWLYVYVRHPISSLFFISFLVLHLFLLHNIVLAVVRKGFVTQTRASLTQQQEWREDGIRLAFRMLDNNNKDQVNQYTIMKVLKIIRPHYSAEKISMLLECVSSYDFDSEHDCKEMVPGICNSNAVFIDWNTFKVGIMNAVNLRLTAVSCRCKPTEWQRCILLVIYSWNVGFLLWGCMEPTTIIYHGYFWLLMIVTTIFASVPHAISLAFPGFVGPLRLLNAMVLGLSIAGFVFLFIFVARGGWSIQSALRNDETLSHGNTWNLRICICLLMTGRCLDTSYILGQFKSFRKITFAIGQAIPYALSQLILILSIMHMFVIIGMGLWAGLVCKTTPEFTDRGNFYYTMNFNTYPEGMVTLFQLLVMNNWHVFAQLYASISGSWVYVYFIVFIVFAVTVVMNVLAAIAIDAFVNEAYNYPGIDNKLPSESVGGVTKSLPRNISYSTLAFSNPHTSKLEDDDKLISSAGHEYLSSARRKSSYRQILMHDHNELEEGGFNCALLTSFALGLGDSAGFQISTAYVRHNGEITSPPQVYLENRVFTELVKLSISCVMTPRKTREHSTVSMEASFLEYYFYDKIRKAMDFTVYEAQSTRELVPPAETRQSLPSLVYTKTIDVGNYIEVEITYTIVNYQDSKLTILFVATRP